MPIDASMACAIDTCSGSPPCEAQASASWSSPQARASKPPLWMRGMIWNGFAHERQCVTSDGSRAAPTSAPEALTTAACTRWRDSTIVPRVTMTSSESWSMPRRARWVSPKDNGARRGIGLAPRREQNADQDDHAADERHGPGHLANTGEERGDERCANGLSEQREVDD